MSKWIEIAFHGPREEGGRLDIHRIQNFAEHLVRQLYEGEYGVLTMDEADRVSDRIRINGIRTRMLRRSIAFLEQQIVTHGFSGDTTMTSGADDGQ